MISQFGKPTFLGEPETIDSSQEVPDASGRCRDYPSWNSCTKRGIEIIKHHTFKINDDYILAWDVTERHQNTDHHSLRDELHSSREYSQCFWKVTVSKNTHLSLKVMFSPSQRNPDEA